MIRHEFIHFYVKSKIFHGDDCYLNINKLIDYFKCRSLIQGTNIDKYTLKIMMTIVCSTFMLFFIVTIFTNTSLAQVTGFEDYNDTLLETASNGSPHTVQEIVASDIVNSSIRDEYNRTNGYHVTVLPPRTDDSIYSGLITFTASEPVRIEVLHGTSLGKFGISSDKLEHISVHFNKKSIPGSLIYPNYSGNKFSYSFPFAGKSLEFSYEKPFVAVYTVNAQVITQKSTDDAESVVSQEVPGAYFKAGVGTLLIEVIPYVSVDTLQELPFSELSASDLATIIGKVPVDRAEVILSKIPADKQQEILKDISAERRQELGMIATK
jgi:MgtE intracellular N domain